MDFVAVDPSLCCELPSVNHASIWCKVGTCSVQLCLDADGKCQDIEFVRVRVGVSVRVRGWGGAQLSCRARFSAKNWARVVIGQEASAVNFQRWITQQEASDKLTFAIKSRSTDQSAVPAIAPIAPKNVSASANKLQAA